MKLRNNCPDQYIVNCNNALTKCSSCCAGYGPTTAKLKYAPINPGLVDHPCSPEPNVKSPKKSHAKSAKIRRALKTESAFIARVNSKLKANLGREFLRATRRSGAENGDGDARLMGTRFGIEHKERQANTTTFSASKSELEKAEKQGCPIFAITVGRGETRYLLNEAAFIEMLSSYLKDVQIESNQEE